MKTLSLDSRSLALFRIGLGLVILGDLLVRATDLRAFYTDAGVLPLAAQVGEFALPWRVSIHQVSGLAAVQALLFLAGACFAVMLIAGWRTRTASVLNWLWLVSLHSRNPMVLQGGDVFLRLLAFWGMFLPLSACWSLDARKEGSRAEGGHASLIPSVAYALQIAFLYGFSVAYKVSANARGIWWPKGEALYYALHIDQFATPLGHALLNFPALLKVLSYAVLGIEALGPLLLFIPFGLGFFRLAAAVAFPLLHMAFGLCLRLGPFPYVASVAMLPFLPSFFWDRAKARPSGEGQHPAAKRGRSWRSLGRDLAVGFFTVYVFLWNMGDVNARFLLPQPIRWMGFLLGLDQQWNMFSPPLTDDGWYVIPGKLRNGEVIDVFQGGGPVDWAKPADVSVIYKNERWRKYMMNLWLERNAAYRIHYGRYLCRDWNGSHSAGEQLLAFGIVFIREDTPPPGAAPTLPQRVPVWKHSCF